MNKRIVSILFLSATLLTVGCNLIPKPKGKLMGGIREYKDARDVEAGSEQTVHDTDDIQRDAHKAGKASEGMEIPAPLTDRSEQILKRLAYTTSYNKDLKLPNWVAWELTADETSGAYKRAGIKFQKDMDVPTPRATDWDYSRSGYDRGHMCPSGDNKWDRTAQEESFLFTNICPQNHNLNTGDWNDLEVQCRSWAKEYGRVYIVCGPIIRKEQHKTIGRNKVWVPSAFFKVVLRLGDEPQALGFICENVSGNNPMTHYLYSVDEIERVTGIDFFASLPDEIEKRVEAASDLGCWN